MSLIRKKKNDLKTSVIKMLKRLHGSFALGIIFKDQPDLIVGARRGSPLAVGYGPNENYLGSDSYALKSMTNKITYLNDGEFLRFQDAIIKEREATGFKKFSLQRQGVGGFLGSRLHARQMLLEQTPGLKKVSERDIDTRQAADFESALLSYTKGIALMPNSITLPINQWVSEGLTIGGWVRVVILTSKWN